MKKFENLKVGDKILKLFSLKKELEGFHNFSVVTTVTKIEPDPNDNTITNVWCKLEDNTYMEFDLFPSDMNKNLIYDDNDSWLEVYEIL